MKFVEISKEDFGQFAETSTGSFLQTQAMAEMLSRRAYQPYFLGVKEEEELVLAAFVTSLQVFGGLKFELNFGPIGKEEPELFSFFVEELKGFVQAKGAIELKFRPNVNYLTYDAKGEVSSEAKEPFIAQLKAQGFVYNGRHVGYDEQDAVAEWQFIKSLAELPDEEGLLKTYNSNAKRNVKKAIKNEISVCKATYEELNLVEKLIENTGEKRHFETKNLAYYQELYKAFGEQVEMLLTFQGEQAIAAGVFIEVNSEFLYLYGGSDGAFGKLGGPFLMQHIAMLHGIERGLKSYNFYGISGNFDGSDGVLRFKQNFGGYIVQKVGEFSYYPAPFKYKIIDFIKKITGRK